jgi:hypothetical protein
MEVIFKATTRVLVPSPLAIQGKLLSNASTCLSLRRLEIQLLLQQGNSKTARLVSNETRSATYLHAMMDETLDKTTLSTISLLEARLLRIEHLLFGKSTPPPRTPETPVATALSDLERRFANLLTRFRVYAELLKICTPSGRSLSMAAFPLTSC